MIWLLWRSSRKKIILAGTLIVLLVALLIPTGLNMAHQYHDALATCSHTDSCDTLNNTLFGNDTILFTLVSLTVSIPLLLGLFWGVPLIAKEYEDGTTKLAWTQSVPRTAWLFMSISGAIFMAMVFSGLASLLVTWWSSTGNALYHNQFNQFQFDTQGIVPIAYAIFAVLLGIAIGAWLRKVLPAIFITFMLILASHLAVATYLRPHYMYPVTHVSPLSTTNSTVPSGSILILNQGIVDAQGSDYDYHQTPSDCQQGFTDANSKKVFLSCLTRHGYHNVIVYQPANRFWIFQWIEASLYTGFAVLLFPITYLLVQKRDT